MQLVVVADLDDDQFVGVDGNWAGDGKTVSRINRLITEAARDPGVGTGKPERLSGDLAGSWSRRIDQEHRLVYEARRSSTADEPSAIGRRAASTRQP